MDQVELSIMAVGGLLVGVILLLSGFKIYEDLTTETFPLRKAAWTCTRSHTEVTPIITMVGKVPVTTMVPHAACDQWSAR